MFHGANLTGSERQCAVNLLERNQSLAPSGGTLQFLNTEPIHVVLTDRATLGQQAAWDCRRAGNHVRNTCVSHLELIACDA